MLPFKKNTGLVLVLVQLSVSMLVFSALFLSFAGCNKKEKTVQSFTRDGWITDNAKVLSPEDNARLAVSLSAYEKETCHQIFVLIIPSLAGESIEAFSQRTAMAWDIGQSGFGNGVLLTMAMQEGTMRLETGSAFDWFVDQGISEKILKEVMTPYFREMKFVEGVEQGLLEIMRAARLKIIPENHRPDICRK